MSTIDESGTPTPIEPDEEETTKNDSLVELLRSDLSELGKREEVLIRVLGYEKSGLQVKYRLPENGKELDTIGRKVNREQKDAFSRNLYTSIDTMIVLCEGLYVQPAGVDEPVMLDPEETGAPARFDERLADMLGMNGDNNSARNVVRRLFNGNDFAIINHSERLNRWLMDTTANLEQEFWQLGE